MSYPVERAITQGIDDARLYGKDHERYDERDPVFRVWFAALVKKFHHRDWTDSRIRQVVLQETRRSYE